MCEIIIFSFYCSIFGKFLEKVRLMSSMRQNVGNFFSMKNMFPKLSTGRNLQIYFRNIFCRYNNKIVLSAVPYTAVAQQLVQRYRN